MYFDSFDEFLAMGGHGLYVWLAYGVTAFTIIVWLIVQRRRRSVLVNNLRSTLQSKEAG